MPEEADDTLKAELSSLLNELKEEKKDPEKIEAKPAAPVVGEPYSMTELSPYPIKKINKLKSGGRLVLKKKNVLGVDIGTASVKIVQIDTTLKPPLLYGFAIEEIPFDLRDKGKKTEDYVIKILKSLIKEKVLVDSIAVSYLTGNNSVYVYSGIIDQVPEAEIMEALTPQLTDKMTFDIAEAIVKYHITGESTAKGTPKYEITAVAAKKESLQKTIWLIEESGLQIDGLSTPSHSFENVFSIKPHQAPSNVVVINFGARRTEINYYREGKFISNREVSVGASDINKAMATKITLDDHRTVTVDLESAENIKRKQGLVLNPQTVKDPLISKLISLYRPILEKIATELKRSLVFFQRSANIQQMDKIYLVGGGANLKCLIEYFKQETGFLVEMFPAGKYFTVAKDLIPGEEETEILNTIIPAAGLFMDGKEDKMNLVPPQTRLFARIASYKHIWNLIIGGIGLGMGILYILAFFQYKVIDQNLRASKNELISLDAQAKQIDLLNSYKQRYLEKKKLVEGLLLSGPKWELLLKELSRLTSKNITFQVLNTETVDSDAVLTIVGTVDTSQERLDKALSDLMEKMGQSPFFKGVELVRMEQKPDSQKKQAEFEIKGWLLYS
jgi:type IV pilus assembly protein PilM